MKEGETMSNALQIVATDGMRDRLIQLVTFTVGGEEFAVDVAAVREIMRLPEIVCMPNSPGYLDGIIYLRGLVVPIISMRERFGLDGAVSDSRTRIMVMNVADQVVGFRVDAVSEVIRVSPGEFQPPPGILAAGTGNQCVTGVIQRGEGMLIVLAPELMLSGAELACHVTAA